MANCLIFSNVFLTKTMIIAKIKINEVNQRTRSGKCSTIGIAIQIKFDRVPLFLLR